MSVQVSDVRSGAFFLTAGQQQLRKVIKIDRDAQERIRVHFLYKRFNRPGRDFAYAQTNRNPSSLERFVAECCQVLNQDEINKLRQANIILPDE